MTRKDDISRRALLMGGSMAVAGGIAAVGAGLSAQAEPPPFAGSRDRVSQLIAGPYRPVVVPNGRTLPWTLIEGVKVFHLLAQEVVHEFSPGLVATCWGYNGSVPGPVIEAVEGDRVRIFVTNHLPAATTVHWHGLLLPSGMDGVGGLSQRPIEPGETFKYEFTLRQATTAMYHAHHDEMVQIGLGLTGLFIIHPKQVPDRPVDNDFAIMLHEWRIDPGTSRPNPNEMSEFNVLTMNGRCFPGTAPLSVRQGERVRIRFGNLGPMSHHSIHLHGFVFRITDTGGGRIPEAMQASEVTVLVPVGATRTVEFVADEPGDWALHCHMTHHVMNQMGHQLPNMIGVHAATLDKEVRKVLPQYMTMGEHGMADMAEMGMDIPQNSIPMRGGRGGHGVITMGGMFTILKVRGNLPHDEDPGWYKEPKGTLAEAVGEEELQRNGIEVRRGKGGR